MGERVSNALLSNRSRAGLQEWIQVRLQVVAVQTAGFHRVRLDGSRVRRGGPDGVSERGSDCDRYGLGHSSDLDRQGADPVRLSTCRESHDLRSQCPLMRLIFCFLAESLPSLLSCCHPFPSSRNICGLPAIKIKMVV